MADNRLTCSPMIDWLRISVRDGRLIPLTGKVVVDREEFLNKLQELDDNLPDDLKTAREYMADIDRRLKESKEQAESLVNQANEQARNTVEQANKQAQDTVNQANQQATNTVNLANQQAQDVTRTANEQANAMLADAQARAQAILADAKAQADSLVAESEIVARATAQAQEMMDNTRRECDDYSMRMHASVNQMLEQADMALSQQLDSLRMLHQEMNMNQ